MCDLPIRQPKSKEGIGGGDQDSPATRRRGGRSGPLPPDGATYFPGTRIEREQPRPAGFRPPAPRPSRPAGQPIGPVLTRQILWPVGTVRAMHLALGAGARHEDGVARHEHPPTIDSREPTDQRTSPLARSTA